MLDVHGTKYLTVSALRNIMADLPEQLRVSVNQVGNLVLMDETGENAIAYIEFSANGSLEYFDDK